MIKKGIISLVCLLFLQQLAAQQQDPFRLRFQVQGTFTDLAVDQLNNIYLLNSNGQLKKLNPNGDSVAVFNDVRRYGKVYAIDVSNPLKTLLYFRDFGTVVVLDRLLGRRNAVDLRKTGLYQVKAVGQAFDNGYWVFDELESKVKHLDESGQVKDQFTDFRLLFDSMPSPAVIIDQNKFLYLYDPAKGAYLFDYYGSFRKRIPYTGWKDFTVVSPYILGRDDQFLYRYDTRNLQLQQYPVNSTMAQAIRILITPDYCYVLYADRLEVLQYRN